MALTEMKCKNCGAKLQISEATHTAKCEYCGSVFELTNTDWPSQYVLNHFDLVIENSSYIGAQIASAAPFTRFDIAKS